MPYRHVQSISGKGGGPDQFTVALRSIAVGPGGRVWAAGDSEVKVFGAAGRVERRWSTARPALAVAVAPDGTVWVGQAGQVEIFDAGGKALGAWRDEKMMGRVTAIGFLEKSVLLGDAAGRAIRRCDGQGRCLLTIGTDNPVKGLLIPNGIVDFGVDARGVIHAANPGKHRVERYSAGGALLGHIGRFHGTDPAGFGGCCNPTNVAVAGDRIYVTEKGGPRAKAYDFEGRLVDIIADSVFDPFCKNMPIAVDARGRVYAGDTVKNTILVFEPGTA